MAEDITPEDLVAVDLPTALRGYRTDAVDELIDRVADALESRDALIATVTEDRDKLLAELRQAEVERDRARTGVAEAEAAARSAVDDARRLRERVQGRAESLLSDAARRADELRAQGRRDAAEAVAAAEVAARAIVAEAEQRRDEHHRATQQWWQDVQERLEDAVRVGERARTRLREELEHHLELVRAWGEESAARDADDEATMGAAGEVVETGPPQVPAPTPPPEPDAVSPPDVRPDADDAAAAAHAREAAATLAALAGIDEHELAELDAPWDIDLGEGTAREDRPASEDGTGADVGATTEDGQGTSVEWWDDAKDG